MNLIHRWRQYLGEEIPPVTKETPYWKSVMAFLPVMFLAELTVPIMLIFGEITVGNSLGLFLTFLILPFAMPLVIRMKNRTFFILMGVAFVFTVLAGGLIRYGECHYIDHVLNAYFDGGDYHAVAQSVSKFASPQSVAFAQFVIDENEFVKQCAKEIRRLHTIPAEGHQRDMDSIRAVILERLTTLDARFEATGFKGKNALKLVESFRSSLRRAMEHTELSGKDIVRVEVGQLEALRTDDVVSEESTSINLSGIGNTLEREPESDK